MKFVILYLKRNIQKRRANYFILFISFVMSGLLISCSMMYTQSGARGNRNNNQMPFDCMLIFDRNEDTMYHEIDNIPSVHVDLHTSGFNLSEIYKNILPTFDTTPKHNQILMVSIDSSCALGNYFLNIGYDIDDLSDHEVYISKYLYYYFSDYIENHTMVFPNLTDAYGKPLKLTIKDVFYQDDPTDKGIFIIINNNALLSQLQEQTQIYNDIYFCSIDKPVDTKTISRSILEITHLHGGNSHIVYNMKRNDPATVSSGDFFIAVVGLCFSGLCIFSAMKLKTDNEYDDYQRIAALGIPPIGMIGLYIADYLMVGICAFSAAFGISSWLFPLMIKNRAMSYGQYTNFLTFDYAFKPSILISSAVWFIGLLLISASILLVYLFGKRKTYSGFVKKSSALYIKRKPFLLHYNILQIRRNKLYTCFFLFLICFPLFICGMYGTSSQNSSIYGMSSIYSDADYFLSVPVESAVDESVENLIAEIENIDAVESVYQVSSIGGANSDHKYYQKNAGTDEVMFLELNDFTYHKLGTYVAEGDLDDVMNQDDSVAVVDNGYASHKPAYRIGDILHISGDDAIGMELTVGAILCNYPYDTVPEYYINKSSLFKTDSYSVRLYIYLRDEISDLEVVDEQLSKIIINPHIKIVNQRAERLLFQNNGTTIRRIAAMMNILICVISVFSLFLFHTQKLLNRHNEFVILQRLGYTKTHIISLNLIGALIPFTAGLSAFLLLYLGYISAIYSEIAENHLYQYHHFAISYIGIILTVLMMLLILLLSVILSAKDTNE